MPQYGFTAKLLATDPRKLVRFPDVPVEKAFAELAELDKAAAEAAKPAPQQAAAPSAPAAPKPAGPDDENAGLIGRVATHLWRARNRMVDPATGEPREEYRKSYRHVEGALDSLTQSGVRLQDWSNKPFDVGLPVKVLSYQPGADFTRDTVIETIRPTVIWNGRMLQMGEVIVGTPSQPPAKTQAPAP